MGLRVKRVVKVDIDINGRPCVIVVDSIAIEKVSIHHIGGRLCRTTTPKNILLGAEKMGKNYDWGKEIGNDESALIDGADRFSVYCSIFSRLKRQLFIAEVCWCRPRYLDFENFKRMSRDVAKIVLRMFSTFECNLHIEYYVRASHNTILI